MSTVLALSAKIKTGKSFVGRHFADSVGWDYVSFGNYVRLVTEQRGLPAKREVWQEVGEDLIRTNLEGFCRSVLAQAPNWKPGKPLVIDGVRHVEVSNLLKEIVAPAKYILALLEVDEEVRMDRLHKEETKEDSVIKRVESHSTEEQVKAVIPQIADYRIDGNEPIDILIEKLKAISSDVPVEPSFPGNIKIVDTVTEIYQMSLPEQREILGRLWSKQINDKSNGIWISVRFGDSMRVVAYSPEQEKYLASLRDLLHQGTMARLESESDGTYEIYGSDRTYFVTMTPKREFAAVLTSWELSHPPQEITIQEVR